MIYFEDSTVAATDDNDMRYWPTSDCTDNDIDWPTSYCGHNDIDVSPLHYVNVVNDEVRDRFFEELQKKEWRRAK